FLRAYRRVPLERLNGAIRIALSKVRIAQHVDGRASLRIEFDRSTDRLRGFIILLRKKQPLPETIVPAPVPGRLSGQAFPRSFACREIPLARRCERFDVRSF